MRSRAFVVLGVLSTALVTGGWLFEKGLDNGSTITGPRLFDEVMTHIERYYVDSVSTSDLYGKAIDGMLDELHDPHSVFLRAERLARLNESTTGNYGGVGETGELRKIGYGRAAKFGRDGQGAGEVGVDGSSEAGAFGVAHDAEMVAAEDATTDDGDAGEGHNYSSGG